jgi:hypothetical protein
MTGTFDLETWKEITRSWSCGSQVHDILKSWEEKQDSDLKFISFLVCLLWNDLSDGETPEEEDFKRIREELEIRGIDPDEVMGY